jgi:hypothetical protein
MVLEVHVIALSWLPNAPLGAGRSWLDQLLPFHRATTGCAPADDPTAVQSLLETHATPFSCARVTPAGLGIV